VKAGCGASQTLAAGT